jgi:hypothetical protein
VIRPASIFTLFILLGPARAQDSDRRDLNDHLGADTVQELTARLMQLQGKLDPNSVKKLFDELKKNPNLTKEDIAKKVGQQSGFSPDQIEKLMPYLNDPAYMENLKKMLGDGKGLDPGGLSKEKLEELTKSVNASAPKVNLPKFDPSGFKPGPLPNLPKGSMPNISPTAHNVMKFWENNFGPLGESPAVKDAIQRMFASGLNADGTPTNFFGFMEQSGYNGQGFANWLNSTSSGSGWKLPSWVGGTSSGGSYGGGSWSWGTGGGGPSSPGGTGGLPSGGSWWSVVLFVLLAGGGLVLWWLWPRLMQGREPKTMATVTNRFAIDPNGVIDRETLIKIFEGLSLEILGEDAKVWTHTTLGTALREYLATNPSAADRLALIYALARYTPAEEPLPPGNLQEARTHLGTLAGVPAG